MRLFIAEKPSLGRAIASGLGHGKSEDGYIVCGSDVVTWCFGHILAQAEPEEYDEKYKLWRLEDLPIIPSEWKLKVSAPAKKQFSVIKKLVKDADEIVNGGDPDREGQLLVDEVLEYLGNKKPVKRILLNALDEKSVRDALANLRDNHDFVGLKNSALARSRADWLIGMNLTRAYTIKMKEAGHTGAASVGRVQTPTMALVVRREEEIKNFRPVTHFVLQVDWNHANGNFSSVWQPKEETVGLDEENRLLDRSVAEGLLQKMKSIPNLAGKISGLDQTEKKDPPRLPYSLSTLQIDAGKKYGLSPQQVLDTMQSLYEKKLTTYPRSDCEYLPENQMADIDIILGNLKMLSKDFSSMVDGADLSLRSLAWNDKKISAHHAIIPTRERADMESLSDMEQKLYLMVSTSYLAQFYPQHVYLATKIEVLCEDERFIAKGKTIKQMGWRSLYSSDPADEREGEEDQNGLPEMQEDDNVLYKEGKILERETKPPTRFTPSSLLEAMKKIYKYVKDKSLQPLLKECHGIGTEATRAGIIETLQKRGFLELKKKHLIPCEKAYELCNVLSDDILYPDTTAMWENALEAIRDGAPMDAFFVKQKKFLDEFLAQAQAAKVSEAQAVVKCPKCGKPMIRRKGSNGFFWGCTGFPACKSTAPDKKGKPDFEAAKARAEAATKTATCPKCGKQLRMICGKNGTFWACEDRENCNAMFSDCNGTPAIFKCPTCGKEYLHRWPSKKKKGEFYWACGNHECKTFLLDKGGKPDGGI